ncbi:unnamed protein product, partial [Meganyctiphanes norvegica]
WSVLIFDIFFFCVSALKSMAVPCNEPGCLQSFTAIANLRKHLLFTHNQDHPEIVEFFSSEEDFKKWKSEYEAKHLVKFCVYNTKSPKAGHGTIRYYRCNVSRISRNFKNTRKMSDYCTAGLKAKDEGNGGVSIVLHPTHYNHNPQGYKIVNRMLNLPSRDLHQNFIDYNTLSYL